MDGLILAGGGGRRFGGDKALHVVDGIPMIVRVHDAISPLVRSVWISVARTRKDLPVESSQVVDVFADAGPLAGLHAGLLATASDALLTLATDLPAISTGILRLVLDAAPGTGEVVVARTPDGRLQPLCARYPRSLLPLVERRLIAGQRSMHGLLEACGGFAVIDVPEAALMNMNAP